MLWPARALDLHSSVLAVSLVSYHQKKELINMLTKVSKVTLESRVFSMSLKETTPLPLACPRALKEPFGDARG